MRIRKLTEDSSKTLLLNLKENFTSLKHHYHEHTRDFKSLTEKMDLIEKGSYEIDSKYFTYSDFQMKLESDDSGTYDFENSKIVYEVFEGLTPSDANDERLWVRLTHDHCHKYMVKRWMGGKEKSEKTIIERFFYTGRAQSSRVRNGIARLWWIAYLTVQKDEKDETEKWKYTNAICESQDFITSILERTMGTYPNVRFGVLEYYMENEKAFGTSKSKKIQQILRDLNNYGGVHLLPLMTKAQVKEVCSQLLPLHVDEELDNISI